MRTSYTRTEKSLLRVMGQDWMTEPVEPTASLSVEQLLDGVLNLIRDNFYDQNFHGIDLDEMREQYLPRLLEESSRRRWYSILNEMLAEFQTSHTQLMPMEFFHFRYGSELANKQNRRYGFEICQRDERFFCHLILAGGPADKAGLLRGDEIVSVEGGPPLEWPALWRVGDAIADPSFVIKPRNESEIHLDIRRTEGGPIQTITIPAREWHRSAASKASKRVISRDGWDFLYLRLFHLLDYSLRNFIPNSIEEGDFEGLILDLRGWGGAILLTETVKKILIECDLPIVALIDETTRSAQERLARAMRRDGQGKRTLIGRQTAGASVSSLFFPIENEAVLLCPVEPFFEELKADEDIEGVGITPDIHVEDDLPYAAGDHLIERAEDYLLQYVESLPRETTIKVPKGWVHRSDFYEMRLTKVSEGVTWRRFELTFLQYPQTGDSNGVWYLRGWRVRRRSEPFRVLVSSTEGNANRPPFDWAKSEIGRKCLRIEEPC